MLDAGIAGVSVLGGSMACASGYAARQAMAQEAPAEVVSQGVNEGLAEGFEIGAPAAVLAFIILL